MYDVSLRSFPYSKVFSFVQNLGCFYRIHWAESWTYGQFCGQLLTTNNFAKLIRLQLISEVYGATLLFI